MSSHHLNIINRRANIKEGLPKIEFGFHQWINFGKYKGKTVYEIANLGDYKYLQWLILPKQKSTFQLSGPFLEHVKCALQTENTDARWEKWQETDYNDVTYVSYYTYLDNRKIESPTIEMQKCKVCNQARNVLALQDNICYKCSHQ